MSETPKTYDDLFGMPWPPEPIAPRQKPTHKPTPLQQAIQNVAWRVELPPGSCIAFAPTKAKARYQAVKAYWEVYGRDKAWPNCIVTRACVYDRCELRNRPPKAWSEAYVREYP